MPAPLPPLLLQLFAAPRLLSGTGPGTGARITAVHLGSRKAMAMLAWLALEGSATRERLATLLWPEADSASSRRNLRRELFRLRELGVPLREAADGTLSLDPEQLAVDALQLLQQQRLPEQAGPALEGLDGLGGPELDDWLQRWRAELAHHHGLQLARQATLREQAGDLAAALALQRQRSAADACNEDAALQVMRLQVALGDRSGALQTQQRLADALRDELDLAPGPAVQDLARSLRQHALPGPATPLPTPAALAPAGMPAPGTAPPAPRAGHANGLPAVLPFIARGGAQAAIEAAWARGQRVYLHGAAGIGKTRLASELAAARGPWLRVACEPQDAGLPYASVVRLLRALREAAPDVPLPDWVQRELALLMPELGPPPQPLATDEARQRLLAAVAEAWRLLVQDNFSALVLDDWHWGDAASVAVWARLDVGGFRGGSAGVAWLVAYRSAELPPVALQHQHHEVDGGRAVRIGLEGLGPDEVLALTRAISGSPGGRLFSQRLQAATEGNPFFLLETLRHLMAQQLLVADASGWSTPFDDHTADYAELPVPPSVRSVVITRVHALGMPMLRLLELAALCRGRLDARLLAAAGALAEEEVIRLLEHAQAAALVHDSREGWRFAHDLVRQSLQQGLSSARQRLLHERLAQQLQQRADAATDEAAPAGLAAELARHWEAAERPAAALRWRVAAAEAALRVHALDEGLMHYALALADGAAGAQAVAIHLACAQVHARRTDRAAADAALDAASACAAALAAADPQLGQALVLRTQLERADRLHETDRDTEALAVLEVLAPSWSKAPAPLHAKALTRRGAILTRRGQLHEALAVMQQAVALVEGLPEARAQHAALLLQLTRTHTYIGDLHAVGEVGRRAVAAHEALDAPSGLAASLILLSLSYTYAGEPDVSRKVLERARAVARRCGDVAQQRGAILNLVKLAVDVGDTETATRLLDEGEALAPGFEHRRAEQAFREARYYLHFLRGEWPQAHAAADRLLAFGRAECPPNEFIGMCHLVVDLYLQRGELPVAAALLDEAQPMCDHLATHGSAHQYGPQQSIKRAWLALAHRQPAQAMALLPEQATLQRLEDRFGAAWVGAAAALALGDAAMAREHLDRVGFDDEVALDQYTPWLQQQLLLGRHEGRALDAPLQRARTLLAEGRVPPSLADGLQAAVNACSTPAS